MEMHLYTKTTLILICLSVVTQVESQGEITFAESLELFANMKKATTKQSEGLSGLLSNDKFLALVTGNLAGQACNFTGSSVNGDIAAWPPKSYNVTQGCIDDMEIVFSSLGKFEFYALSMLDATGKPGDNILQGNLHWIGSYSECRSIIPITKVNKTWTEPFQTQFCSVSIVNTSSYRGNPAQGVLSWGLCVPDSCTSEDVRALANTAISFLPKEVEAVAAVCQTDPDKIPLDSSAIGVLVMVAVFATLIICGSLFDLCHQHRSQTRLVEIEEVSSDQYHPVEVHENDVAADPGNTETSPLIGSKNIRLLSNTKNTPATVCSRLLLCFSVFTNGDKLLTVGKSNETQLGAIHGIRFLSMSWVILGHTYVFGYPFSKNVTQLFVMAKTFTFQAILNATVSVDSFFVLSGTLVAYLLLKEIRSRDGPKHVSWWKFYIHRYWRLTPPYMLVLGTYVALFKYIGEGPYWPMDMDGYCRTNWWTNLLYINNLVKEDEMCFGWSWYLANDMQFFIISPLLIVPFTYSAVLGVLVNLPFLVASITATGVITANHGYPADLPSYVGDPAVGATSVNYMKDVYFAPWCRIGPYIIGIFVGYLLHRTKRTFKMHWALALLGWAVAAVLNTSVLYGLYNVANGHLLSNGVNAFYAAVHRSVWAVGLGWVIFACCTGNGGPVNRLLSWSAFVPLSRLTYMAYLIHPIIIYYYNFSQETPFILSNVNMIYIFLGHLVVTYGIAFVVSLTYEAPLLGLEKIIFPRN